MQGLGMPLTRIARKKIMNNQEDLYDARVGVETYARYIRESLLERENWRDMVRGAAELCLEIEATPACRENPYLCNLIMTIVVTVLLVSEDYFGESDRVRELALVRSTKRAAMKAISEIKHDVDECYPEIAD